MGNSATPSQVRHLHELASALRLDNATASARLNHGVINLGLTREHYTAIGVVLAGDR